MLIKEKIAQDTKYAVTSDVAEEVGGGRALDIILISSKFILKMVNSN